MPEGWLALTARDDDPGDAPSVWDLDPERQALDSAFERMVVGARSLRTLSAYRAPFLKLVLWLAVRGLDIAPPSPGHVKQYLVFLNSSRRNKSAADGAVRALQFVGWLNGWPSFAALSECRVPIDAASRAFGGPVKKAAPADAWMIVAINRGLAAAPLAERMIGWALLACYMCVGRFSDLCRLRWDVGYYESHPWGLRFFFDMRKTDQQYAGQWIDIAAAEDDSTFSGFTAVAELRAAHAALGGRGPVLRRTTARRPDRPFTLQPPFFSADHPSLAGLPMNMTRGTFQNHYQRLLVEHCGISVEDARAFSTHGIRAGAATSMVKHKVPAHIINARAGVTSIDWIAEYDRVDLDRRLAASRALGL
ncbi:MAG: hypothetical protein AAF322_08845 [Pseudomonadota bacterium]